jgi:transposase-like protein
MASARKPETLQQAILFFSDYTNCHRAVMQIRWPDGVVRCPHCGSDNVTYLESVRRWKCYGRHPKAQFSLKVGTIFEDSPVGLEKWLPALWLVTTCKNGISSYELARALGVMGRSIAGKIGVIGLLERHPENGMSKIRLETLEGRRKHHLQPVDPYGLRLVTYVVTATSYELPATT